MLRRQARLRREYLYRKTSENNNRKLNESKDKIKNSLENSTQIHGDLRAQAIQLEDKLRWNDEGNIIMFI